MKILKLQNYFKPAKIKTNKQMLGFKMNLQNYRQGVDENCVQYGAAKIAAKEILKNENVLYGLYSGKTNVLFDDFLNDEEFLSELYSDSEFIKASTSALLRATDDKLKDEAVNLEDKKELALVHNILTVQKELYNDPQNSFSNGLEGLKNNRVVTEKNGKYFISREPQIAFGTIFNYGVFNKPKTRRQKAEAIVNRQASKAAAKSAILLSVSTALETAALTENTINMCRRICETYEMPGTAITALISQVSGALAGKTLASLAGKFFPGAGNIANATITYAIHEVQGRAIIDWCEKNYDNPDIKDWDLAAKGINLFRAASSIGGNPVDNYVNNFGKDDLNDFINS